MTSLSHGLRRCVLASLLSIAGGGAAWAQASAIAGNNLGVPTGPVVGTAKEKGPKAPLPPALPGSHGNAEAAPASKTAMDLPPTEALFDAINRGDITAARDAVNRGADLRGRNVLGMTPTELSVDLARNDITFLLLSLRGPGDSGPPAPSGTLAKTNAATPGRVAQAERPARTAVRAARAPATAAQPAAPATSRQYATGPANPGTPVPQAGFLGFGVTR